MQFSTNPLAAAANLPNLIGTGTGPDLPSMGVQGTAPAPFADLLTNAIGNVNQLEDQARITVDGMMAGSGVDVHQAMIATEKASMAFEMVLAVRNKAVQAYQSVIGMQF
jgi:flagellar hook-basal body complex protein FliE